MNKINIITISFLTSISILFIYIYLYYLFAIAFPIMSSVSGWVFLYLHLLGGVLIAMVSLGTCCMALACIYEKDEKLRGFLIGSIAITIFFGSYIAFGIIVLNKILN